MVVDRSKLPAAHAAGAEGSGGESVAANDGSFDEDLRETPEELESVRARDPRALEAFFERHIDRVYNLAYRLTGDEPTAQDVTQDVFWKIHRAAHTLDPARDPRPWIHTITYNTCREIWRSGAHRMRLRSVSLEERGDRSASGGTGSSDLGELAGPSSAGFPDPEEARLLAERERMVQEAILQLPEGLRAAVLLHDYEGLGHEEVAAVTGISHAAARKRYSRAISELSKILRASVT